MKEFIKFYMKSNKRLTIQESLDTYTYFLIKNFYSDNAIITIYIFCKLWDFKVVHSVETALLEYLLFK